MSAVRTLITGGAGFIGSHLCERFLAEGHEVVAVDNLLTGNLENLDPFRSNPKFKFIGHDVSNPLKLRDKIDNVLHFASPASPVDYLEFPIQTLKVGSLGTHTALGLAKHHNARVLLASTSEVYVNPVGIRGVYDEAKRFAESMTMAYHRVHGVNTHIVRIFNTYGERMRLNDGRVLPNFMYQALMGEPLTIYGDGKQTRSFQYVSDLVEGIYRLIATEIHDPVNIGNPAEITMLEFAEEILKLAGSKSQLEYRPLPQDDPKKRQPDITRARTLLGWEPKVGRDEGLKRTMAYFKTKIAK